MKRTKTYFSWVLLLLTVVAISLNRCDTILFVVTSFISLYILIRQIANTQTAQILQKQRLERLDYESAVLKQFYETKLGNEEELRALRHDMKRHLLILSTLLSDSKTAEASQYLSSLVKLHQNHQAEIFCWDPYMNAVLYTFAPRFSENNISFTCHADVEPHPLPGMEVCVILGNALDNALEASLFLPKEKRCVKVQATVRKNQLLLRIINRFSGRLEEENNLPLTTKTEKGHGYGLANIRCTAERLGGSAQYHSENGFFILDIHFPLPKDS